MALRFEFDPLRIGIDGFERQTQDMGDLLVGLAVRYKFDDIQLAVGQWSQHRIPIWVLVRAFVYGGGEHRFFHFHWPGSTGHYALRNEQGPRRPSSSDPHGGRSAQRSMRHVSESAPAIIPGQLQCFFSSLSR